MNRSKAFFIDGGAGRVLCSIPALERYAQDSGDEDFVIVCEGGMDFYRGNFTLQKHAYENWHKGLFDQHIKDKDIVSPEPYRINEYFNQKCSLAQAYDIEINNLEESRKLPAPTINLNKVETINGYQTIQGIKSELNKDKAIIIQPFGRSVTPMGEYLIDFTSRSFELNNVISIINQLREKYAVIIMTEYPFLIPENKNHLVAVPKEPNLRLWASMINSADHFLGCDSVGQHMAKALGKTATVVIGSTVPINITYPNDDNFDIIDMGKDKERVYSPIRVSIDDEKDRTNDKVMMMNREEEQRVVNSCIQFLGKGTTFAGKFTPTQQVESCSVHGHSHGQIKQPTYNVSNNNLLSLEK